MANIYRILKKIAFQIIYENFLEPLTTHGKYFTRSAIIFSTPPLLP
jgi:hypothetical protein